jgi:holliday junction DNA helicase RuvA
MIGWLKGRILSKVPPGLLLDVNGVGYELEASMTTFCQLPEQGQEVALYTHFWVREDAQRLFGFINESERAVFRRLIKVSGVGAKVALAILSSMSPDEFVACVLNQELAGLVRVPGIGKKTAERLLIEVKDSVSKWSLGGDVVNGAVQIAHTTVNEAIDGLVTLGYKPADASKMVRKVGKPELSSAELIRAALQEMAN